MPYFNVGIYFMKTRAHAQNYVQITYFWNHFLPLQLNYRNAYKSYNNEYHFYDNQNETNYYVGLRYKTTLFFSIHRYGIVIQRASYIDCSDK